MPNDNLTMGYRARGGSEEQLVNDMDDDEYEEDEKQEEMEEAEQQELEYQTQEDDPHKHVYFVTDPRMSSWSAKDDDPHSSTKLG